MQLFEDRIGSGGPLEGLAARVVGRDEVVDALHELSDAGERAAANRLVGYEVHVPARPSCEPRLDLRMALSGVVVGDAVDANSAGTALSISRRKDRNS